ncbi:MAG: sensor histidine kinase [Lachnospiraceae bacterium]|jgi:signal transduction histidine kinase|nr:sensor histidine kinase [Lachnospiraceae bacterium]
MKKIGISKDVIRFLLILIVLFAICSCVFYFVSLPHNLSDRMAHQGVIDLRGEDMEHTLVNLDGEWEFYYEQLINPQDFLASAGEQTTEASSLTDPDYITVPGSWDISGYPLYGYATYRLTILSDEEHLMILIPEISDASVVYINEEEVFRAGNISTTEEEFVSGLKNKFIPFEVHNGEAQILVQVSNFDWIESGMCYRMELGRPQSLMTDGMMRRIVLAGFIGMLLTMTLYHIILFLTDTKNKPYLYFSLMCLCLAFRFSIETNGLIQMFYPKGLTTTIFRFYVVMLPAGILLLILFTHSVFQIPFHSKVQKVIYIVTLGGVFLTSTFIPFRYTGVTYVFIAMIPVLWSAVMAIKTQTARRNPFLWLYIISCGIFTFWGFITKIIWNDRLFMPGVVSNLFLVLGQFVILALDYGSIRQEADKLRENNKTLDGLIKLKSEFLSNISHEMKTPLAVISVHIQRASKLAKMDPQQYADKIRESLSSAQNETMRIARIMENALRVASQQESRNQMEKLDIASILKDCAETYRLLIEKHGNVLMIDIPQRLPFIWVNGDLLIQVISNLLGNAAKHTRKGSVTIQAQALSDCLQVTVTDDGEGIEPGVVEHVFDRGVSSGGSTGLGLSICKNIIAAHGGEIRLMSTAGKGTTVVFTLPLYTE